MITGFYGAFRSLFKPCLSRPPALGCGVNGLPDILFFFWKGLDRRLSTAFGFHTAVDALPDFYAHLIPDIPDTLFRFDAGIFRGFSHTVCPVGLNLLNSTAALILNLMNCSMGRTIRVIGCSVDGIIICGCFLRRLTALSGILCPDGRFPYPLGSGSGLVEYPYILLYLPGLDFFSDA